MAYGKFYTVPHKITRNILIGGNMGFLSFLTAEKLDIKMAMMGKYVFDKLKDEKLKLLI